MSVQFEDLFDWEKENDVHYYSLLNHIQEEEWQYMEHCTEQAKKKPAKIVVITEKSKKNETNNASSLRGNSKKRV